MRCPHCNSDDIRVTDTLPGGSNALYRRRKCKTCGEGFKTVEITDDGSEAFAAKFSRAKRDKYINYYYKEKKNEE